MIEGIYRKDGASVVLTRAGETFGVATSLERGMSGVRAGRFFSGSGVPGEAVATPDAGPLLEKDRRLAAALPAGVAIERMQLVAGGTRHAIEPADGAEGRAWNERHARLHLEIVAERSALRIELERGGGSLDAIDIAEIANVARALEQCEPDAPPPGPKAVRLAPPVVAALTAALAAAADSLPPEIPLVQAPLPALPLDGAGLPVERFSPAGRERRFWPNVFRPSYRSPDVPAVLHARLELRAGSADTVDSIVLELLQPPRLEKDAVLLTALVESGSEVRAATARISLAAIPRLTARGTDPIWFPYGAGSWGRDVTASEIALEPWRVTTS
ncbi:MAG: hypothetical protein ACRD2J_14545 [Thermoanaerobaculia bacterium]